MPIPLTEMKASSLVDAFDKALQWATSADGDGLFWFRGVNDSRFHLEPGAYWRKNYDEVPPLLSLVQEGRSYADVGELDEWATYYFAQHHGIPTRLLDWTESFSAALFFAFDNWDQKTTPCVWIVSPQRINELSLKWRGVISPEQNQELNLWLPRKIADGATTCRSKDGMWIYDSALPLAIYPRKANNRIVAQQGTFTVHGTHRLRLNEWIVETAPDHKKVICRILLDVEKKSALEQLNMLGTRRHTMYPDIENYVSYLREYFGW